MLGPFGTFTPEVVTIQNGKCSSDSKFFSDAEVDTIAKCALKSYDSYLGAHFLWTGHNEIEEKWDFIKAYDKGWIKPASEKVLKQDEISII
jgi:hypothetical protein